MYDANMWLLTDAEATLLKAVMERAIELDEFEEEEQTKLSRLLKRLYSVCRCECQDEDVSRSLRR